MEEKIIFPTIEIFKIGRVTYKVSAHFDKKYDTLKPKIEKLLKREIENNCFYNESGQKKSL